VFEISQSATRTARAILALRERNRQDVENARLLDYLFEQPILSIGMAQAHLGCTYATAKKHVEQFVEKGLLREVTGHERNRRYRYDPYLALFDSAGFLPDAGDVPGDQPIQVTQSPDDGRERDAGGSVRSPASKAAHAPKPRGRRESKSR
jgi:hypothetical protein